MRERIRKLMESNKMTQQMFAETIGISPASMSSIFSGRTNPTINTVEAIKRRFPEVSTDWLVFGREPMYMDKGTLQASAMSNASADAMEVALPFDEHEEQQPAVQGAIVYPRERQRSSKVADVREVVAKEKPRRTITEIRVFFDDQTYESFTPRK